MINEIYSFMNYNILFNARNSWYKYTKVIIYFNIKIYKSFVEEQKWKI